MFSVNSIVQSLESKGHTVTYWHRDQEYSSKDLDYADAILFVPYYAPAPHTFERQGPKFAYTTYFAKGQYTDYLRARATGKLSMVYHGFDKGKGDNEYCARASFLDPGTDCVRIHDKDDWAYKHAKAISYVRGEGPVDFEYFATGYLGQVKYEELVRTEDRRELLLLLL